MPGDAKSTKLEAHYTDGPVKVQPCKSCSMWRGNFVCSAVIGMIEPLGHCKFYEKAK